MRAYCSSISDSSGNEELVEKLNSEIRIEQEQHEQQEEDYRGNIKEFLDNTEYQLEDVPGQEEVALVRKYNDETIRVVFSVADFNSQDTDPDQDLEDPALFDEDVESSDAVNAQSGGANTKGSTTQGRTRDGNLQVGPDESVTPADRPELRNDQDSEPGFPANVQIHISRPGKGALTVTCIAEDGNLQITDVYYFPKSEMAEAKTPDAELARRTLYTGPPFGQLDEDLQDLLEAYLDERGINTAMALFIPDYIDVKEQKEYIGWLGSELLDITYISIQA